LIYTQARNIGDEIAKLDKESAVGAIYALLIRKIKRWDCGDSSLDCFTRFSFMLVFS
jgi:hypothetical protein